jgi:hypothetical protein
MAPKSASIFIILAIIRRITIGKAIFFEYFFDIIDDKPLPVTIPICAQISTITVMNGYRNITTKEGQIQILSLPENKL